MKNNDENYALLKEKKINQGFFLVCPGSAEYKKKQCQFRNRLKLAGILPHLPKTI